MKIGDVIIYVNEYNYANQYYTVGKQYEIFKIDDNFIKGQRCGYIKDDKNNEVYFKEDDMFDENWKSIKYVRKQKLKKLENEKM